MNNLSIVDKVQDKRILKRLHENLRVMRKIIALIPHKFEEGREKVIFLKRSKMLKNRISRKLLRDAALLALYDKREKENERFFSRIEF
jgi:hypothetical protein